ncbi:hypothetical protein AX334_24655, partial [Salmonella enterica]|nr:hypothetical protein [Salmonella enterica]EAY8676611.1 hypothetical protein [Salmonella enterica]EBB7877842.1 hypothetical protein [Salmonella enterica]ECI4632985.1 hypothetical protein [Salmonella enterica subsp. enterica serovar Hartford]
MKVHNIYISLLLCAYISPTLAGKPFVTPGISISNDLDKKPIATDVNGRTGIDGADQGTAVGATSQALLGSVAIGDSSKSTSKYGIAIGTKSNIAKSADEAIALGKGSQVKDDAKSSVALGAGSVASQPNTVSIGSDKQKRKLVNLDNGDVSKNSSEAVTGNQLYQTNQTIESNKAAADKGIADNKAAI